VGSVKPKIPEIERAQLIQFMTIFSNPVAFQLLGTNRTLLRRVGEIFDLDEAITEELGNTAQNLASGGMPGVQSAGPQGSQPGIPDNNPVAAVGGAASGIANFRGGQ
jgi:hypothetical protein